MFFYRIRRLDQENGNILAGNGTVRHPRLPDKSVLIFLQCNTSMYLIIL